VILALMLLGTSILEAVSVGRVLARFPPLDVRITITDSGRCGEVELQSRSITLNRTCRAATAVNPIEWTLTHEMCHILLGNGDHGDQHQACILEHLPR
jgi:hypothetical protein